MTATRRSAPARTKSPSKQKATEAQAPKASNTAEIPPYNDVEFMRSRVLQLSRVNLDLEQEIEALKVTRDLLADALAKANHKINDLENIPF